MYDFCLFNIPKDGKRVLWEITQTCNYKCIYCISNCNSEKKSNELSFKKIIRSMNDLSFYNFNNIKFTGGEPFTRNDMIKILEYGTSLNLNMDISTNASLITDTIAKNLALIHFPKIHVSLDDYRKEKHDIFRGKNSFVKTISGYKKLKKYNLYTRIGTLIHVYNEYKIENMVKFAINIGTEEIIFSFLEPAGRLGNDVKYLSQRKTNELKYEIDEFSKIYSNQIKISCNFGSNKEKNVTSLKCPAIDKFLHINHIGQLSPCTWVSDKYKKYTTIENLKKYSLKELLIDNNLLQYRDYINNIYDCGCPMHIRDLI